MSESTRSGFFTATEFEFRYRFWLIGLVFWVGFFLSTVDHVNVVEFVVTRVFGLMDPAATTAMRTMFGVGALCVLAAALLRTWATSYLRTDVMQDSTVRDESLVADGPYRHVRNPLYLGNMLLVVGFGLLASRSGFVVLTLGMLLVCLRLIGLEEQRLAAAQGESYLAYRRRVPSLVPSLRARVPASGRAPRWGQAFLGEAFVWAFFFGIAVFAITLQQRPMWISMGVGLAAYIVLSFVREKRKN
jgi:protein-S-isoprenylcysteine O-methyltransferase Ste14